MKLEIATRENLIAENDYEWADDYVKSKVGSDRSIHAVFRLSAKDLKKIKRQLYLFWAIPLFWIYMPFIHPAINFCKKSVLIVTDKELVIIKGLACLGFPRTEFVVIPLVAVQSLSLTKSTWFRPPVLTVQTNGNEFENKPIHVSECEAALRLINTLRSNLVASDNGSSSSSSGGPSKRVFVSSENDETDTQIIQIGNKMTFEEFKMCAERVLNVETKKKVVMKLLPYKTAINDLDVIRDSDSLLLLTLP